MTYAVMVSIEGVLANELTDLPSGAIGTPIPEGIALLRVLRSGFNVLLSSLAPSEITNRWLVEQGITPKDYANLYCARSEDKRRGRIKTLERIRSAGYNLAYVFDSDPEVGKYCVERAITPMLCPHPTYGRSAFLPTAGQGGRTWDEITAEIERRYHARQTDSRTEIDNEILIEDDDIEETP